MPEGHSVLSDFDQDGISNSVDQCPNISETYNGFQDDDGCPDSVIGLVFGEKNLYTFDWPSFLLVAMNRALAFGILMIFQNL